MKLSNAGQPTCTLTSGEVHHVYMYLTCPDAGTLLSCLNIVIICVCVCVCVCYCLLLYLCKCVRRFVITFYFLSICEHSNLYLPSFSLCVL